MEARIAVIWDCVSQGVRVGKRLFPDVVLCAVAGLAWIIVGFLAV